jgi:hypothetical protein
MYDPCHLETVCGEFLGNRRHCIWRDFTQNRDPHGSARAKDELVSEINANFVAWNPFTLFPVVASDGAVGTGI